MKPRSLHNARRWTKLLSKLRDLEALFAGATTPGERDAAGNARERITNCRLRELERNAAPIEYQFTMRDMWTMKLSLALLRRYDLKPYRYRGQRHTTVMDRVPQRFVERDVVAALQAHERRAAQASRRPRP